MTHRIDKEWLQIEYKFLIVFKKNNEYTCTTFISKDVVSAIDKYLEFGTLAAIISITNMGKI